MDIFNLLMPVMKENSAVISEPLSHSSQIKPGGNTKTPGTQSAYKHQYYRWVFTLKYEELTLSQLLELLKQIAKEFCFSGEEGKGGYKHWQGCFSLKTKDYFATVKNHFPNTIHLEPCKHWFKAKTYCIKEETHIEGPYDENFIQLKTIDKLNKNQEIWLNMLKQEPDDRTIIWIGNPSGGIGKSQFLRYMAVHHKACIFNNAKTKDIAYALPDNPKIVMFNFSRSLEGYVNYDVLESLKDGMLFSSKYESRNKIFNSPHVVIMANFYPDESKLTNDRWKILKYD